MRCRRQRQRGRIGTDGGDPWRKERRLRFPLLRVHLGLATTSSETGLRRRAEKLPLYLGSQAITRLPGDLIAFLHEAGLSSLIKKWLCLNIRCHNLKDGRPSWRSTSVKFHSTPSEFFFFFLFLPRPSLLSAYKERVNDKRVTAEHSRSQRLIR